MCSNKRRKPKLQSCNSNTNFFFYSANLVRQARNAAEKQRRDKLNTFINDLANAVPFTPYANKRLDKISILRLSAAYLRLHLKCELLCF